MHGNPCFKEVDLLAEFRASELILALKSREDFWFLT